VLGPLPESYRVAKQYTDLQYGEVFMSTVQSDNCFLLDDGQPSLIKNILSFKDQILLVVVKFQEIGNFFEIPLPSMGMSVYRVRRLASHYTVIGLASVKKKCVCLPFTKEDYIIIPLTHFL